MASLSPEALMAALSDPQSPLTGATLKAPPPGDAAGGQGPPDLQGGGAPQDPNAPPDQGQGDQTQQAVWSEFPATDPQSIQSLAQQAQGAPPEQLIQLLGSFMQQAEADQQKLSQMHEAMMAHLMELLGGQGADMTGPGGAGAEPPNSSPTPPPQGPGVGGAGAGY